MDTPHPLCTRVAQFDYGITDVPEADDAAIDRWHDGALDCYKGRPQASQDKDYLAGWTHAQNDRPPVEIVRPEGYYHMPLGTFD